MRRVIVLGLLVLGLRMLQPLGTPGFGAEALLAFGFLILGAYAAGEIAESVRLPRLLGYIAAGAVFGPQAFGTITAGAVEALSPITTLAIALIAFLAGAELRWEEVRTLWRTVLRILAAESGLTFVVVAGLMFLARDYLPFLAAGSMGEALAFSLLFASIAIVHSPAVVIALLNETRADGPVARTSLAVVLVSDVVVVMLLTVMLSLTRAFVPGQGAAAGTSVGAVLWHLGGAVFVGAAFGALIAAVVRYVGRDRFFFAIIIAFFGDTIARIVRVEPLLMLIATGFVVENLAPRAHATLFREAMQRAAAPVFVVFFALAGASVDFVQVARFAFVVVPLVLVRIATIWMGTRFALSRTSTAPDPRVRDFAWTGLIAQAGVAIGLVQVVAEAYPQRGGVMRTLFIAMVTVNQALGPVLFRWGLARSGEIASGSPAGVHIGDEVVAATAGMGNEE